MHDLVLHDNSTRGPIGSIQLLWRLPLPVTWQWIGCVLIIVALAVGPLTQLVLQYEQCSVLTDIARRDAIIPRTSLFFGQGSHSGAAINTLSLAEQNSINAGIYSLGYVGASCSSGNGSFAPFTSLGYCSECEDISTDMRFITTGSYPTGSISSFIPGGLSANWSGGYGANTYAAGGKAQYKDDYTFMIVIGPPNTDRDGAFVDCSKNRTWACQGYAAAACSLYPCIRNYTASMTNGTFVEAVVNTWRAPFGGGEWSDGRYYSSSINKSCLTKKQSSALRDMGYSPDEDGPWMAYNGSADVNRISLPSNLADIEQELLDQHCIYAVDLFFANGLDQYLSSSTFAGNVTGDTSTSSQVASWAGPQLLLTIFNFRDISFERTQAVFRNLSLSLTNHMRVNPGLADQRSTGSFNFLQSNTPAPGLAYTTKTCLRVRWGWLAFPTILAALTLLFFTGVILNSSGLTFDVRTWKSSPLPLLFYGSSLSETPTASQHIDDLNRAAERTNVSLMEDEDGSMVLRKQGGLSDRDSEI